MSAAITSSMDLPDINTLRSEGAVPHWFGLGFIQVDLPDRKRLHFWVNDWPQVDPAQQQWHDHRYDFTSHVLKGEVSNRRATIGPLSASPFDGCMEVLSVHCKPSHSTLPSVLGYCLMREAPEEHIISGHRYFMPHDVFHISTSTPGTITLLERDDQVREAARLVQPMGRGHACPFESTFSPDQCWQRIAAILEI